MLRNNRLGSYEGGDAASTQAAACAAQAPMILVEQRSEFSQTWESRSLLVEQ